MYVYIYIQQVRMHIKLQGGICRAAHKAGEALATSSTVITHVRPRPAIHAGICLLLKSRFSPRIKAKSQRMGQSGAEGR